MTPTLRFLRAVAAASLLAAGGAAFAAAPVVSDELLAPLEAAYLKAVQPGDEAESHRELFGTVLRRVQRSHALEVDGPKLVAEAMKSLEPLPPGEGEPAETFVKAVNAALASLDPHSRYLDARALARHRNAVRGSYAGLGISVSMVDGLLRVMNPIPGTPAARAGLRSGDLIVRFDDQPVLGMTQSDAVSRMRGEPGTPIALTIRRTGRVDEFTVSLVREVIRREPVRWRMESDVLVLRLLTFTTSAFQEMEKAIADATAQATPRALVLDLRGNAGGLFRQALLAADAFLSEGTIVSVRSRLAKTRRWLANPDESLAGVPIVVLVDGRTASAAELVAAALQENGRATVMGQRSFGKGSIQALLTLGEDQGALRLTTALYHGPSGRTVQRTGVGPDIELVPAPIPAGITRRREADRAHSLPGADEPPPPKARIEEARCAKARNGTDAALACALAFIDAGRIDNFLVGLEAAE